ncbi:hypothetical protein AAFG13_17640 [Bradyrhizobium sp. B124]|uniref:hypothetical protein n=1 Tax=Bradyrhizobium sp. B124 TaxID=3140245 RepID=UPI003183C6FF
MKSFSILSLAMDTFWSSPPAQYRLLLFPGTVSGSSSGPERRAQPRVPQALPGGCFDSGRVMDKQPIPIGEQIIITIALLVIFALVIWYGAMI